MKNARILRWEWLLLAGVIALLVVAVIRAQSRSVPPSLDRRIDELAALGIELERNCTAPCFNAVRNHADGTKWTLGELIKALGPPERVGLSYSHAEGLSSLDAELFYLNKDLSIFAGRPSDLKNELTTDMVIGEVILWSEAPLAQLKAEMTREASSSAYRLENCAQPWSGFGPMKICQQE